MKDNEKNLNNALSDESAESVAGGIRWPWQSKWSAGQKKFIQKGLHLGSDDLNKIVKKYSPEAFINSLNKDPFLRSLSKYGGYSDGDINCLASILDPDLDPDDEWHYLKQ